MNRKHGFTLIELLVVIAIIALLVSILMPALSKAKEVAKGGVCVSNLRNMFPALQMYMNDHNGVLTGWFFNAQPGAAGAEPQAGQTAWMLELYRTMGGNSAQFTDTKDIWASRATDDWVKAAPIQQCPGDVDKANDVVYDPTGKKIGSYKPNIST
jgi:prepilin-type N-terminal cleavage/methylation domain-containing protein